jgi:ATP-dependent Clp protease protease subunit
VKILAKRLKINGPIIGNNSKWIYDLFGMDATCPKDIEDIINSIDASDPDKDLEVMINSPGGSVSAGSEIYTLLNMHVQKHKVTGVITGFAASAASVAAMGCSELYMTPTGQMMIHNAKTWADGDHRDMSGAANMLRSVDEGIANSYILKTGMSRDELLDLMGKETWMSAQRALQMKFVDKVLFDESSQLAASAVSTNLMDGVIPEQVINKVREMLASGSNLNLGDYKKQLLNYTQKGDGTMTLDEILNGLPEDQRNIIQNAIDTAKEVGRTEGKAEVATQNISNQQKPETLLTNMPKEIQDLFNQIQDSAAKAKASELAVQAELQKVRDETELKDIRNVIKDFDKLAINADEMAPVFRNFMKADKNGFEMLKAVLNAANNAVKAGKIFNSNGKENAGTELSAFERIQVLAKDKMTANNGMQYHEALTAVMKENPELYDEYRMGYTEDAYTEEGE